MEECQQRRRKEELQMTEERIEKSHGQRQEGISGEHMRRDHRISKNRTYDLMYMKTKEQGWKENHGIQNIDIEDSQGNMIIDQR
jgi:hypothetical protein